MKKWAWFKREEPQQGDLFSSKPTPKQIQPAPKTPPSGSMAAPRSPDLGEQTPGAARIELSLLHPPTSEPAPVPAPSPGAVSQPAAVPAPSPDAVRPPAAVQPAPAPQPRPPAGPKLERV